MPPKRSILDLDVNLDEPLPELFLEDPRILSAWTLFTAKASFLLTGPAGTGKSTLIQEFRKRRKKCGVTAMTGIAAVNIQGSTLHSYLRIFPSDLVLDYTDHLAKLKKQRGLSKKIRDLDCLIIDEVSMLDKDLFERLEFLIRHLRGSMTVFGGLQVILVGDFYQLPPVKSKAFLFQSPLFYKAFQKLELTTIFRQSDPIFQSLLLRMRSGDLRDCDAALLESRKGIDISQDGILPTKLFSTNVDVDTYNAQQLENLPGDLVTYTSGAEAHPLPEAKNIEEALQKFCKDYSIGPISLKVGAQVLLTMNLDLSSGLCNGSRGVVTKFDIGGPVVRFRNQELTVAVQTIESIDYDNKVSCVSYNYLPLKLAWGLTIHKSQGMSLDLVEVSLDSSIFAEGQAYVAVSRARSLEGLSLRDFQRGCIKANREVHFFSTTPHKVLEDYYSKDSDKEKLLERP
jgi:ATP-dependent DNA helicase PIF1